MQRSVAMALCGACLIGVLGCSGGGSSASKSSSSSAAITGAAAAATSDPAPNCSPFGNPPATVTADQYPGSKVPACYLGQRLGPWKDRDGYDRYACLYEPPSASSAAPLPLLVYIHPSLFPADTLETATDILEFQNVASLSADPDRAGFIVLAPQGRSTKHFYPSPDDQGLGWDNWYRQFDPGGDTFVDGTVYPENVDAVTIDHFLDRELATGKVDTNRIYVTGWSNGAAMSYIYGLSRPSIAAIAVYSAPDPFHAFNDPCPQVAVADDPSNNGQIHIFNEGLPTMHVHNDCDIAGLCPNGERMATLLRGQGIIVDDLLINSLFLPVSSCLDVCGTNPNANADLAANPGGITLGSVNHTHWPQIWTPAMLEFLRAHPLDSRPRLPG